MPPAQQQVAPARPMTRPGINTPSLFVQEKDVLFCDGLITCAGVHLLTAGIDPNPLPHPVPQPK